jgi:Sigma-70, region 4
MQSGLSEADNESVWRQLAPLLDEAMARLTEKERAAVGLRYFENRSAAETAALLGIGQWAAHKRTERAVEKLRAFFARRGVGVSAASLTGAVSAHSVQVAPAMLAKSVAVVALAKGAGAGGSTLALVKGALRVMAWTKAKTAAVGLGAVLIAGMGTVVVSNTFLNPREPSYHGRVLSEWLADLEPPKTRAEAQEAIRQMGKKTLPFLVMDLAWPGGTAGTTKIHYAKPDTRSGDRRLVQARMAFEALGPLGKPAVPKLVKLLEQNPGYVPHALGGIGRDALPQMLNALTNGSFWCGALRYFVEREI